MAFFTFSQNNSGGSFRGPEYVIIEAASADEANEIALDNDIYFDGVRKGYDCECCGDRWEDCYERDATDSPEIFGEPAADYRESFGTAPEYKIVRK